MCAVVVALQLLWPGVRGLAAPRPSQSPAPACQPDGTRCVGVVRRVAARVHAPYALLWRRPTVREGLFRRVQISFGQPALLPALGRIVVASGEGDITAHGLADGHVIWRYRYGAPLEATVWAPDVASSSRVLVGTRDGHLLALDAADGRLAWRADIDGEVRAAPRLADGLIIVATSANKVFAIEADGGQVVWSHGRAAPTGLTVEGHARPMVAEGRVYASFSDGVAAAFSLADGTLLWTRPLSMSAWGFIDADADPCTFADAVFVASYSDGVYALHRDDGRALWHRPLAAITSLALASGQLVAASADGVAYGLDPGTGQALWRTSLGDAPLSRLAVDGDRVVLTAGSQGLIVLDAESGRPRQASGLGERAVGDLALAGPWLSFLSERGQLYLWQRGGTP